MTTRELMNHNRDQIENACRANARTAFLGDAVLCRVINRFNMYVDPLNYDMAPWLMLDGYWEPWVTMAIGRAIQPGWTCLDVGAWCGYYTVLMADLVGPTGKVIAFEPNHRHVVLCERSVRANGQHWVKCYQEAAGNEDTDGRFLRTDGGGSRLSPNGEENVSVVTIDGEEDKIDFIKMDIEGGERDAWDGMQKTIDRNPNIIIVMEWEPARYPDAQFFAGAIAKSFRLRDITTDGLTVDISIDDLLKPVMRNLWLQA